MLCLLKLLIMFIFVFVCAAFALDHSSFLVVYSNKTSKNLLNQFREIPNWHEIDSFKTVPEFKFLSLIIDLTSDSSYLPALDYLSESLNCVYLTTTRYAGYSSSNFRYQILLNPEKEAKILEELLKTLKISSFSIFCSSYPDSIQISTDITSLTDSIISSYIIEESTSKANFINLSKRLIKGKGLTNVIILGYGDFIYKFQTALDDLKLGSKNINFIFNSLTAGQIFIENSIFLTHEYVTEAESFDQMIYLTIMGYLKRINFRSSNDLEINCDLNICSREIQVFRVEKSIKKMIAEYFNGNFKYIDLTGFSGSLDSEEGNSRYGINLLIANGSNELNTNITNPIYAEWYKGALYGIQKTNSNKELGNFEFITKGTNCGNDAFEPTWYYACLSSAIKTNPVAYLTSSAGFGSYGNLIILKQMGLFIPQVAGYGIFQGIDNSTLFPEYLTLSLSMVDYALSGPSLLAKNFGWKDVIIIGTEDLSLLVNSAIQILTLFGLNIINPENLRLLPANYTRDDFHLYKEIFYFAKKSKCRFYIIYCKDSGIIIEGLYDAGLRKGDFMTYWNPSDIEGMINEKNPAYLRKRLELIQGGLIMGYKEWEGSFGVMLKQELNQLYSNVNFMCLTYDAFLLIKNSIQDLVSIGEDFEDPTILMAAMRRQRMTGCVGNIYFSKDFNTRVSAKILLRQIVLNDKNDGIDVVDFIVLDRYSINTVLYLNHANWVGGVVPTNYIELNNCGFDEREVRSSEKGKILKTIFSCILIGITFTFSLISYKIFKTEIPEFELGQLIKFEDMIVFFFFLIEFFQLIILESKDGILSNSLTKVNYLVGFDLIRYFKIDNYRYWIFYIIILCVSLFSVIFSILNYLKVIKFLQKFFILKTILDILQSFVFFVSHFGFFSIIYLLLSIYDCEEAVGDSLNSSYLLQDCKQFCYQDKHYSYLITGSVALYSFAAVLSFLRPYWKINHHSNIKTSTKYLAMISCFQVLVIIMQKVVGMHSPAASGYLISGIILTFSVYTWFVQPYNYKRAAVAQVFVLILSSWCILISSFYVSFEAKWYLYFILLAGIFIGLIAATIIINQYPKGFKEEIGLPINNYIKFQFYSSYDIFRKDSLYFFENPDDSIVSQNLKIR